jgi:hypothetical protein
MSDSSPKPPQTTNATIDAAMWIIAILAVLCTALCLLAVARINIAFATSWNNDPEQQIIVQPGMAAVTLLGAGMLVAWQLMRKTNPGLALAALVYWLAYIGLSSCAGYWFLNTEHRHIAVLRDAKEIEKDLDTAQADLAKIPAHRPTDTLEYEINKFREQWYKSLAIAASCCDIEAQQQQQRALYSKFLALEHERKDAAMAGWIEAKITKLLQELILTRVASAATGHSEHRQVPLEAYLAFVLVVLGASGGMLIASRAIAVLTTANAR